jgi:hypothetical protein
MFRFDPNSCPQTHARPPAFLTGAASSRNRRFNVLPRQIAIDSPVPEQLQRGTMPRGHRRNARNKRAVKRTKPPRQRAVTRRIVHVHSSSQSSISSRGRVGVRNASSLALFDSNGVHSFPTFTCSPNIGRVSRIKITHYISAPYHGAIGGTTLKDPYNDNVVYYQELSSGDHDIAPGYYRHVVTGSAVNHGDGTTVCSSTLRYYHA